MAIYEWIVTKARARAGWADALERTDCKTVDEWKEAVKADGGELKDLNSRVRFFQLRWPEYAKDDYDLVLLDEVEE